MTLHYRWTGGQEAAWQIGPENGPSVLVVEPLFEERNRMRRLIAQMARLLAQRGIRAIVPDLPGCGESLTDISDVSFADLSDAVASALTMFDPATVAAFRGGALLVPAKTNIPCWQFAPETGARVARDLRRTESAGGTGLFAGHPLTEQFLTSLSHAELQPAAKMRIVRLESDAAAADVKFAGPSLWRWAEPGQDTMLATALAADLADWVERCAA